MKETLLTALSEVQRAGFGREMIASRHRLHEQNLWDDPHLADMLDRYPRERLGVFTMGEDPTDWTSWRRIDHGGASGETLVKRVREERIWLNLRLSNAFLPEIAELEQRVFGELKAQTGARTFKRDLGLLISSPRAQVFYHLDTPLVALFHLRGDKRAWVYPRREPFVDANTIERVVLRETAEQFPYRPEFDAGAHSFAMSPGDWLSWPQNAPHRLENGGSVNVSLSAEFLTPAALIRANEIYANGVMRRRFGACPKTPERLTPASLAKAGLARLMKAAPARQD